MAFIMVSVAYGIAYIFGEGSIRFPIGAHYIIFIFGFF